MAAKKTTDETSVAQNRFVVSLPKDVGEQIDKIGERLKESFRQTTGVAFDLSRAQIVQALVRQAIEGAEEAAEVAEEVAEAVADAA